jgi:D-lactate dehydrogenase
MRQKRLREKIGKLSRLAAGGVPPIATSGKSASETNAALTAGEHRNQERHIMKVAVFSTRSYDREFLGPAFAGSGHELTFFTPRLTSETAPLAAGFPALCVFVQDVLDRGVLATLAGGGTRLVALRSAGFNNVDLMAAAERGITVVRVPAYSPHAVAEFTVGLMLTLNRKIHRAAARVREGNFALEGLLGFDFHGRTLGIVGTGQIGAVVARIMHGFGCRLLAYDLRPNQECESLGVRYCPLEELFEQSDIISLHCPLTPETHHLIDKRAIARMKTGVMLVNTSRGAVIETRAVISALKSGKIASLGLDVYEEEADLFFQDLSDRVLQDDVLARLLTFPNVVVTGHQAFFTREALSRIAETTAANVADVAEGRKCSNAIDVRRALAPARG